MIGPFSLNAATGLRLEPWPHFVEDNFLASETIDVAVEEIGSYVYEYEIDERGKGRIEFALLQSRVLWKALYSKRTSEILSSAFQCNIFLNKENLIQLRRMNNATPSFPLHNDFILGSNTIVSFLYLSKNWSLDCGGRLLLQRDGEATCAPVAVEPIFNRLVAFQTKAEHWHSVESVTSWERLTETLHNSPPCVSKA